MLPRHWPNSMQLNYESVLSTSSQLPVYFFSELHKAKIVERAATSIIYLVIFSHSPASFNLVPFLVWGAAQRLGKFGVLAECHPDPKAGSY